MKKLILFGATCAVLFSVFSCTKSDISSFMTVTGERAEIDLDKVSSAGDVHDAVVSGTESGVKYYYLKGDYSKLGIDGPGSNPFAGSTAETVDFSRVVNWDDVYMYNEDSNSMTKRGKGMKGASFRCQYPFVEYAFLEDVKLPDNFSVISEGLFSGCVSLLSVEANEVHLIGTQAFENCFMLRDLTLPKVDTVFSMAFDNCRELKELELPSLTFARKGAFQNCAITKAVFPNLRTIEDQGCFLLCDRLEYVDLPCLECLPSRTFSECPKISEIRLCSVKTIGMSVLPGNHGDIDLYLTVEGDMDVDKNAFIGDLSTVTLILNKDKMPGGGASPEADPETGTWAGVQWKEIRFVD